MAFAISRKGGNGLANAIRKKGKQTTHYFQTGFFRVANSRDILSRLFACFFILSTTMQVSTRCPNSPEPWRRIPSFRAVVIDPVQIRNEGRTWRNDGRFF
jgi:hypothetical protein